MSKRESSVGLISILVATFGLSIAGIWSAYHFGFGSHSDVEYTYIAENKNTSSTDEFNELEPAIENTPVPTPTPTPIKLKTADDIASNPVQAQIEFLVDSSKITSQGVDKLNQLKKKIAEFDPQSVGIRIDSNFDESELNQEIGKQRGEEVAGYLRYLGLKHKIVIAKRSANVGSNISSQQQSNQQVVVELYKL